MSDPHTVVRCRSLVRDDQGLRSALAHQGLRRSDLDAAREVREHTEDLLETLESIARDESFWNELRTGRPIAADHEQALRDLDPDAFELLLQASGYESPPPPPARELVDETMTEMTHALQTPAGVPDLGTLSRARRGLLLTLMRVRRQIADPVRPPAEPSTLSAAARAVGQASRWLIPRAAALAAEGFMQIYAPGSGFGGAVVKAAQQVLKDGIELGATRLLGRVARAGPGSDDTELDSADLPPPPSAAEIVRSHIALTVESLGIAQGRLWSYDPAAMDPAIADVAAADIRAELRSARRHIRRIGELLEDHGALDETEWEPLLTLDAALSEAELDLTLDPWPVDLGLRALREVTYLTEKRWGPFDRD